MEKTALQNLFTQETLQALFPKDRADAFFEALFGDVSEGAYDIGLEFKDKGQRTLRFNFYLTPRFGKCLACNLTYGLPGLFSRHPVINVEGLVTEICEHMGDQNTCTGWQLGETQEISPDLHIIPLIITLDGKGG